MKKRLYVNKKSIVFILVFTMVFTSVFSYNIFARPNGKGPSAPTNLSVISVDDTSISFTWTAPNVRPPVRSYDVFSNNIFIGNTTSTTYTLNDLTSETTYNITLRSIDSSGSTSVHSNILTVKTAEVKQEPIIEEPVVEEPIVEEPIVEEPIVEEPTIEEPVEEDSTPDSTTRVVGYYAAWAAYSGFTPDKIDASKLTHINYAFANIGSDLRITMGYPDRDPSNFAMLNQLKEKYPHIKTIIAVGGWSWSGRFSDVALTETSRNIFADSVVDFIVKHGFDGVDIDWEYPVSGGLSTNVRRPEDKQNFTLLLRTLREKLDARGQKDGKDYILTFAGAAGSWYVNNTELHKIHQYVDFANIMTYDIHGTWDRYTDFNAPLYNNKDASPQYKWSVDSSIKAWVNAGFPKEKLVMGVPFYGYIYHNVPNVNNGLYQTFSNGSSITYRNIAANYLNNPEFTRYYHTESMVPWLFNGSTFISYEDEESIGLKAQYIQLNGLGGAMIWELSHDPNRVLLNALYNGLHQ